MTAEEYLFDYSYSYSKGLDWIGLDAVDTSKSRPNTCAHIELGAGLKIRKENTRLRNTHIGLLFVDQEEDLASKGRIVIIHL